MQNRQCGKNINILLKLYRSILGEYRYTSLELAVRPAAFVAYTIAKFPTDNPIKAGSGDNNK
ncbi:hypothetical protein [Anabaena sp. UHCC 0399]|uniref:hypothetical protein n=1 Tax=Anabaena sp. UHCC 0399 TaxID=3110238 RepID=UPI002B1F6F0A|nr:hypothetical protein [Anabaena sp. UHCC 0399]MEA5565662.1 hypothetical protein [Anabaena sp. UHCC 0399]